MVRGQSVTTAHTMVPAVLSPVRTGRWRLSPAARAAARHCSVVVRPRWATAVTTEPSRNKIVPSSARSAAARRASRISDDGTTTVCCHQTVPGAPTVCTARVGVVRGAGGFAVHSELGLAVAAVRTAAAAVDVVIVRPERVTSGFVFISPEVVEAVAIPNTRTPFTEWARAALVVSCVVRRAAEERLGRTPADGRASDAPISGPYGRCRRANPHRGPAQLLASP